MFKLLGKHWIPALYPDFPKPASSALPSLLTGASLSGHRGEMMLPPAPFSTCPCTHTSLRFDFAVPPITGRALVLHLESGRGLPLSPQKAAEVMRLCPFQPSSQEALELLFTLLEPCRRHVGLG